MNISQMESRALPHTSFSVRLWVAGKDVACAAWELGLCTPPAWPGFTPEGEEPPHAQRCPGSGIMPHVLLGLYLLYY